jgi:hypothetical protein
MRVALHWSSHGSCQLLQLLYEYNQSRDPVGADPGIERGLNEDVLRNIVDVFGNIAQIVCLVWRFNVPQPHKNNISKFLSLEQL